LFKFIYTVWMFFLRAADNSSFVSKKIIKFSTNFNKVSWFCKLLVVAFNNKTKDDEIVSFRRKIYPFIHTLHVSYSNTFVKKNTSLKIFYKEVDFILLNRNFNTNIINSFNKNEAFNYFFFTKFSFKHFHSLYYKNNFLKLNFFLSQLFDSISLDSYKIYNLNYYSHWYKYNFNNNQFVFPVLVKSGNLLNFESIKNYRFSFYQNFDLKQLSLVEINNSFKKILLNVYPTTFSESSTNKFISFNAIADYCVFYIRKNKIFNKGRYSRNRQLYRTGFYWCLYFNIVSVYGLYFLFYRVVFNFGYIWIFLIIFFGSFIFSRMLKYNYFNLNFVAAEVSQSYNWLSIFVKNTLTSTHTQLLNFELNYKNFSKLFFLKNASFFKLFGVLQILKNENFKNFKVNFFWLTLKNYDNSFLRVKTISLYLSQLFVFFSK